MSRESCGVVGFDLECLKVAYNLLVSDIRGL